LPAAILKGQAGMVCLIFFHRKDGKTQMILSWRPGVFAVKKPQVAVKTAEIYIITIFF
jgi:hypothetical protein